MSDQQLPPAITGTDMRLDALIRRIDRLCDLLTPKKQPEPNEGTVELREPVKQSARKSTEKTKRT